MFKTPHSLSKNCFFVNWKYKNCFCVGKENLLYDSEEKSLSLDKNQTRHHKKNQLTPTAVVNRQSIYNQGTTEMHNQGPIGKRKSAIVKRQSTYKQAPTTATENPDTQIYSNVDPQTQNIIHPMELVSLERTIKTKKENDALLFQLEFTVS